MGEWILSEACRQLTEWHQTSKVPISMSINLSARQFQEPDFLEIVKRIVERSRIAPHFLTLEIAEGLLQNDMENKIDMLNYLKDMGFKLSIDDFGTGYSSLSYLRKLPIDELKIDQSFISDVTENADSREIISTLIFLATNLGMVTVAVGVETKEQLHFLQKVRCHQYQGFLFSRSVPNTELFEFLTPKD